MNRLLLAALSVLLLSSCAATVERRIEKNPALFAALSPEDQQLVREGRFREGMTQEAVFLAAGRPGRVMTGPKDGKDFERWSYIGQEAIWTQTYGAGWGGWAYGGWGQPYCGGWGPGFNAGPSVTYIPYEAATVDFVNRKVVGWATNAP